MRRKFGAETAKQLAALLKDAPSAGRLVEFADLIIDCASAKELLARMADTA